MIVTVFSFAMSVLFSTLFILAIHLLRNRTFFLHSFGVHTILGLYALCLFRSIAILELPFTVPVGLGNTYSAAFKKVWSAHISVGNSHVWLLLAVCCVWAVVTATLMVQFLWKNWNVARKTKWYSANRDSFAEKVLERIQNESWRAPAVRVCICPTLHIPMGIGLFRHSICLPEHEYTQKELYYILKHEYTHFRNHDLTVKFLVHLFCCIFWWNPAVYLLKKDISQILEIKCDRRATEGFSKKERLEYLFTIVRILERTNYTDRKPPSMLAVGLAYRKNGDDMRERFRIMTSVVRPVSKLWLGAFWALAITLVVGSYSFVFQPAFDPPVEDIYTDSSVYEWDNSESFITKDGLGTYYYVFSNGTKCKIDEEIAKAFLADGRDYKEDNTNE